MDLLVLGACHHKVRKSTKNTHKSQLPLITRLSKWSSLQSDAHDGLRLVLERSPFSPPLSVSCHEKMMSASRLSRGRCNSLARPGDPLVQSDAILESERECYVIAILLRRWNAN